MTNQTETSNKKSVPDRPLDNPGRGLPTTRLGKWSLGLVATYLVLLVINQAVFMNLSEDVPWRTTLLPFYGIGMMACGLAAGITGLLAVLWKHERSWVVFVPLFFGAFVVVFLLGELLMPH